MIPGEALSSTSLKTLRTKLNFPRPVRAIPLRPPREMH
jgi:hypothetical protein